MQTSLKPELGFAHPSAQAVVSQYKPLPDCYDEMFEAPGVPRSRTEVFGRALSRVAPRELSRRWQRALRQIRENGVTYNIHGDEGGLQRPWQLDPVPLLVPAAQWQKIEEGLAQRAYLLDQVLQDLYGRQRLVRHGVLPPELVFANPAFLRPCHGSPPPGGRYLHMYAADVTRGPAGDVWVVGDRTQAPSGSGYALENRLILSRALPNVYRECSVERLAPFFQTLLETLQTVSPRVEEPHMVLLTPGPYNETYFEHAYLARYLGLTLAQGSDLTVRNRTVYLKTLGGLERVDVILRRVDDLYCDPLSLRGDSALGVPGLLSAVRAGKVAVLNTLGSGAIETPALMPFLPGLCRYLLGEELKLPSVATWWCGQPAARKYVEDRFESLVLKPAFPGPGKPEPVFAANLSGGEKAKLRDRIRARPYEWVAQERIRFATAPAWEGDRLVPKHVAMRCHMVSSGSTYVGMRGGLTRVARDLATPVVSMQHGAESKDTWVLADGAVSPVSLLGRRRGQDLALSRSGGDLPSRVADNLFWLGRYAERAEIAVRLLRELTLRLTDDSAPVRAPELPVLVQALESVTEGSARLRFDATQTGLAALESELLAFVASNAAPNTLRASLAGALRAASAVRDRMSADTWRVINQVRGEIEGLATDMAGGPNISDALDALDNSLLSFAAFAGLCHESFTRTLGYRFLEMGRRIERGLGTARLLRSAFGKVQADEPPVMLAVLQVLDTAITYRRRYQDIVQLGPVLDLLLLDESNPRSLAFQIADIHHHVQQLPRDTERPFRTPEEQTVLRALTRLRLEGVEQLASAEGGRRTALVAELNQLLVDLPELSDHLTRHYLAHAVPVRTLGLARMPSW